MGTQERVKVLLVSDYCSHRDTARVSAQVQSAITNSMPGWHVSLAVVYGAFEDDFGLNADLDGATARLKGERQVKRMRVDLLTSCAKVLRSIGAHLPDFLIGFGQGGLIAGMLRFPLVVECTLQARNLQRSEIWKVVTGWAQVKGIWACSPRVWKTHSSAELVLAACPEVGKSFPIEPVKGYGIGAHGSKEAELAEALQLGRVKSLVELPLASLAREEGREVWEHDGKCAIEGRTCSPGASVALRRKQLTTSERALSFEK